jgi:hypothetical protein
MNVENNNDNENIEKNVGLKPNLRALGNTYFWNGQDGSDLIINGTTTVKSFENGKTLEIISKGDNFNDNNLLYIYVNNNI